MCDNVASNAALHSNKEEEEVHAALGKCDHAVLTLDFQSSWSQDNTDTLKYMYGRGDYEKLGKMMSGTDWEEQLDAKTVEQAWTTVRSQLEAAVASCIPKKTTRPGDARSRKPWNTSSTIRNSRDKEDYLSYAKARNQATSAYMSQSSTRRILPARSNGILNISGNT